VPQTVTVRLGSAVQTVGVAPGTSAVFSFPSR